MAIPTVRAVGAVISNANAVTPIVPTGTVAGDLLLMVCESGGPTTGTNATTALTASGWSDVPSSPQQTGNTRLTVLYRVAAGSDATTTNDTGDHQIARIIGITAGTFDAGNIFNTSAGGTQTATQSVSVPGATTNLNNCLILAFASGDLPDLNATTEFGAATNASLSNLTERIDNSRSAGDGGAIWAVSGGLATAGTYNATTCTATTTAVRGVLSIAINEATAVSVALTGVVGTGAVGSLGKTMERGLTGVAGTGAVGTLSPGVATLPGNRFHNRHCVHVGDGMTSVADACWKR